MVHVKYSEGRNLRIMGWPYDVAVCYQLVVRINISSKAAHHRSPALPQKQQISQDPASIQLVNKQSKVLLGK